MKNPNPKRERGERIHIYIPVVEEMGKEIGVDFEKDEVFVTAKERVVYYRDGRIAGEIENCFCTAISVHLSPSLSLGILSFARARGRARSSFKGTLNVPCPCHVVWPLDDTWECPNGTLMTKIKIIKGKNILLFFNFFA